MWQSAGKASIELSSANERKKPRNAIRPQLLRREVHISAEEREVSPATSAMERARTAAGALEYFLAGQDGDSSAGGFSSFRCVPGNSGGFAGGDRRVTPTIIPPDQADIFGDRGIFKGIFTDPSARTKKQQQTRERRERNRERRERNRQRARDRRVGGEYETDSALSKSSDDSSLQAKSWPGSSRMDENLRIGGGFPDCLDIKDWDIYVSKQYYNARGHIDKLELTWLERVLAITAPKGMSLSIVPDEMADLEKCCFARFAAQNGYRRTSAET